MAAPQQTDLKRLQAQMKGASREVKRAVREPLKEVGRKIADDAKDRIRDVSPETAAEIKVRTRLPGTVVVQGGSRDRPIGKLLEGHDGIEDFWTHPLFGDEKHRYAEKRHPHLYPAFVARRGDAEKELADHVNDAMHSVGLKGFRD